jgi:PleD family two-component response regulator
MSAMAVEDRRITHDAKTPRILVVDDDMVNLQLIKRVFDSTYAVTCVDNGYEALKLLGQESFYAVLIDIMMPQIKVLEVLQHACNYDFGADGQPRHCTQFAAWGQRLPHQAL